MQKQISDKYSALFDSYLKVFEWQADYFRTNDAMGWVFRYFDAIRRGDSELARKIVQTKYDENKKAENQRKVEKVLSDSEKLELDAVSDTEGKKGLDGRLLVQRKALKFMENWTNGVFMMIERFGDPASSNDMVARTVNGQSAYAVVLRNTIPLGQGQNAEILKNFEAKMRAHQDFLNVYAERNASGGPKLDKDGKVVWNDAWRKKFQESLAKGYKNDAGKTLETGITEEDVKHIHPVLIPLAKFKEYYSKMGLDVAQLEAAGFPGVVVFAVDRGHWFEFEEKLGHEGAQAFADQQFQYEKGTLLHDMIGASYLPLDAGKDFEYEYVTHEVFHPVDHLKNELSKGSIDDDQALQYILGEVVREIKAHTTGVPKDNDEFRGKFEKAYREGGVMYDQNRMEESFDAWLEQQRVEYWAKTWKTIFAAYLPDWVENKLKLTGTRGEKVQKRAKEVMKELSDTMMDLVHAGVWNEDIFSVFNSFTDTDLVKQIEAICAAHKSAKTMVFGAVIEGQTMPVGAKPAKAPRAAPAPKPGAPTPTMMMQIEKILDAVKPKLLQSSEKYPVAPKFYASIITQFMASQGGNQPSVEAFIKFVVSAIVKKRPEDLMISWEDPHQARSTASSLGSTKTDKKNQGTVAFGANEKLKGGVAAFAGKGTIYVDFEMRLSMFQIPRIPVIGQAKDPVKELETFVSDNAGVLGECAVVLWDVWRSLAPSAAKRSEARTVEPAEARSEQRQAGVPELALAGSQIGKELEAAGFTIAKVRQQYVDDATALRNAANPKDVALRAGIARALTLAEALGFKAPSNTSNIVFGDVPDGKLGYYNSADEEIVLSEKLVAEMKDADAVRFASLSDAMAVAILHEWAHMGQDGRIMAEEAELAAYHVSEQGLAMIDKLAGTRRYEALRSEIRLLLLLANGEVPAGYDALRRERDIAIQILIGNADPVMAMDTLINRLISQVYVVNDPDFVKQFGDVKPVNDAKSITALAARLMSHPESAQHTVVFVDANVLRSESWEMKNVRLALDQLRRQTKCGVFVRNVNPAMKDPPDEAYQIGKFAAALGIEEFSKLMEVRADDRGYFSVFDCRNNDAISMLLADIKARRLVGVAA